MGTNNINSAGGGRVLITKALFNAFASALKDSLVPRNASGVATDIAGGLGTSSYRWDKSYIKSLVLGAIASGLEIDESSGSLIMKVGGTTVFTMSSTGLILSFGGNNTAEFTTTSSKIRNGSTLVGEFSSAGLTRASLASRAFTSNGSNPGQGGVATDNPGTASASTSSFTDITGAELQLTTKGGPVLIGLIGQNSSEARVDVYSSSSGVTDLEAEARFWDGSNSRGNFSFKYTEINPDARVGIPPNLMSIAQLSAGSHTLKLQGRTLSGSTTIEFRACQLFAFEIGG